MDFAPAHRIFAFFMILLSSCVSAQDHSCAMGGAFGKSGRQLTITNYDVDKRIPL